MEEQQKEHFDLGILLVHGIGSQKRGDTLLQFGEPMAESLAEWLGKKDAIGLRRTELVQPGAGAPAHSHVVVTYKGETKSVLVAESLWADSFGPPPWWPFAKWLLWSAPFVILRATDHRVSLIATHNNLDGVRRPAPPTGPLKWGLEGVRVLKNALSVLIALVATIGILLLGIVALIPRVRTSFLSAQKLLVGYVGDCYLLLISRGRGDAMVSQVERDLKWLEENHENTAVAVIAHSQGAEIVRRVLERREKEKPVDLFVTLGSGIAKLRAVEQLHGKAWAALRAYSLRVGAAVLTLAGPLYAAFGPLSWWLAGLAVLATAPVSVWLINLARVRLQKIVLADDLPKQRLKPLVGTVKRWFDFYATSDPVPEDALPFEKLEPPGFEEARSTRIANRRSPLFDHTSYWQNAEAFRAPVIAELARLIGWRPAKPTRKLIEQAQEHRLQKSKRLVAARYAVVVVAAAILLLPAVGVERETWSDVATWLGGAGDWAADLVRGDDGPWLVGYPERHILAVAVVVLVGVLLHATYASTWQAKARQRGRILLSTMPAPDPAQARHHQRRRRPFRRRSRAGSAGDASGL